MSTPKFSGIIPPIVTPLQARDTLDVAGLERLVDHIIGGGVSGLFALGTTGEGPSLSYRLRREMIQRTIEFTNDRVPVMVGITDTSFEESVALAQHAADCGATALVLAPPYYFAPAQPELLNYVEDMIPQLPLPLFLYNMPGLTKVKFELDTVQRLTQNEKIVGIKDSSGDFIYFQHLLRLSQAARPDWAVLMGAEELLAFSVLAGAHGGVSGSANLFPRLYVSIYEAAKKGDLATVHELQNVILTLGRELYTVGKHNSATLKGIKGGLAALQICQATLAEPFEDFHSPEKEQLSVILEKIKSIVPPEIWPAQVN